MNSNILIVEDSLVYQTMIREVLSGYNLLMAGNGLEAIEYIKSKEELGLIVLDLHMPEMNGFEFLEYLNSTGWIDDYSVIILTASDDVDSEIRGLELGAFDYIRKPFNASALQTRIKIHLKLINIERELKFQNKMLEEIVVCRTEQIQEARDLTTDALISLLEKRDLESCNHSVRTKLMMKEMCNRLRKKQEYKSYLTTRRINIIVQTAPLHDIGKIGIEDAILLKPAKLSKEEFLKMQCHVEYGCEALTRKYNRAKSNFYIETALKIIGDHHEKWDGSGYPTGKSEHEISLEGRMMAVIDVYDALINKRVYKPAYSHEESIKLIFQERGRHFDPDIVDEFIAIENIMYEIQINNKSDS